MIILQSNRLYVRRYALSDVEMFYALNSDPELMQHIRPIMDYEKSKKFLEENIQFYETHPTLGRFALIRKADEQVVGSFSLLPLGDSGDVHIGYVLFKPFWGMGYAAEIVAAGIEHAIDNLNLSTLAAITYPENHASQKVLLRNGFEFERSFLQDNRLNNLYRLKKS